MDNLDISLLEGLRAEIAEDYNKTQKGVNQFLKDLESNHPKINSYKITEFFNFDATIFFGDWSAESRSWTEYHNQWQDRLLKQIYSQVRNHFDHPLKEEELNNLLQIDRGEKNNQLSAIFHAPSHAHVINTIRQNFDDLTVNSVINMRDTLIRTTKDLAHGIGQSVLPDIDITAVFPTPSTTNVLQYCEEGGTVHQNWIYSLPSITLDTNIIFGMARGDILSPFELYKKCWVDLAVTHRIEDDADLSLSEKQFLRENGIRKIPSIMRGGFDTKSKRSLFHPQFNKGGSTEFVNIMECAIDRLAKSGHNSPEYLDWDHLHGHYTSGRDIFVTQDKKMLRTGRELEEFGIRIMSFDDLLELIEQNGLLSCIKYRKDLDLHWIQICIKGTEKPSDLQNFDSVIPFRYPIAADCGN